MVKVCPTPDNIEKYRIIRAKARRTIQVAQLSQRNRAAGCVSFGWVVSMAWVKQYSAPNVIGARNLKALIFYTINPLLYKKRSLWVFEPILDWGGA